MKTRSPTSKASTTGLNASASPANAGAAKRENLYLCILITLPVCFCLCVSDLLTGIEFYTQRGTIASSILPPRPEPEFIIDRMQAPRTIEYQDAFGQLRVEARAGHTSLFFDSDVAQSAWQPNQPDVLAFGYYRALLMPLVLSKTPKRITLLGLGGGALARFLLEYTPHTITCWDVRPILAEIARDHFQLDLEHPRLNLHFADLTGKNWAKDSPEQDIILVDLFDHQTMIPLPEHSVEQITNLLAPDGVLAVNVWRSSLDRVVQLHRALSQTLHGRALTLHIPERLNTVMCYRRTGWQFDDLQQAWQRREQQTEPVQRALAQAWPWIETSPSGRSRRA